MKKTLALILPILGLISPNLGSAAPIAQFSQEGTTVTLTDEVCKFKDVVINLPRKVVWKEKGQEVEGCWGMIPQVGFVTMYFADKTVVGIPVRLFTAVTGA